MGNGLQGMDWVRGLFSSKEIEARNKEKEARNFELLDAAEAGNMQEVDRLINDGADIEATASLGETVLMMAAMNGHDDVCTFLIYNGADVNKKQLGLGNSALMWAARKNHYSTCKLLIEKGANVNMETEDGDNALRMAAGRCFERITQLLLENGANVNAQNNDRQTPLMHTVLNSTYNISKLLIDYGAYINAQDAQGSTALILVARDSDDRPDWRSLMIAQLLIDKGADLYIKDAKGMDALAMALAKGHSNTSNLLVRAMANLTKQQKDTVIALVGVRGKRRGLKLNLDLVPKDIVKDIAQKKIKAFKEENKDTARGRIYQIKDEITRCILLDYLDSL